MSRLLITTPLEETWSDEEPVLFLGEWCRLFERRARWSKLEAALVPYHWDDRAKLESDYRSLSELHERLLSELRTTLNEIHGVDHSLRYWRILLGPWLGYFIPVLFDRWESIQQAVRTGAASRTIILTGGEDRFVPQHMTDFGQLFIGDEWNHHIYATLLRRYTNVPCLERPRTSLSVGPAKVSAKRRLKRAGAALASRVLGLMTRRRDAFLISSYLPVGAEVKLHLRLGQSPQLWPRIEPDTLPIDATQRKWTLRGASLTEFERAARELVAGQIPVAYLEGYKKLVVRAQTLHWPKTPRVIWTSNSHIADDVFKAWAADKVERGAPLVIGQHGGHFGIGRWCFEEDHDIAISDRYLSWGWSKAGSNNVVPLGQLTRKRPLGNHRRQRDALLVTFSFPRYSYWMLSAPVAAQYLQYLEDQYAFLNELPRNVRERVVVRLFARDTSWAQELRMRERLPDVRFDDGRASIDGAMRRSRLYVATYNATTFLESMTRNVPTVIYWNPRHWELRAAAVPYFDELRAVGVFHETPQSAARHVAEVWDRVEVWWASDEVREVVKRFTDRFASTPVNLAYRIEQALQLSSDELAKLAASQPNTQ